MPSNSSSVEFEKIEGAEAGIPDWVTVGFEESKEVEGGADSMAARKPSTWGTVGWWFIVVISVPFSMYAALFVYGDFKLYSPASVASALGRYEEAGQAVLHHLRAWQIHALAAEAYIVTGPFQFSPKFRKSNPAIHRLMGYIFVSATVVLLISAAFVLIPNTDFGPVGATAFSIIGVLEGIFLFLAVRAAKQRKFRVHQKFMIRTAALGYSVMMMRLLPATLHALGMDLYWAFETATILSPVLFSGAAELYIQTYVK